MQLKSHYSMHASFQVSQVRPSVSCVAAFTREPTTATHDGAPGQQT